MLFGKKKEARPAFEGVLRDFPWIWGISQEWGRESYVDVDRVSSLAHIAPLIPSAENFPIKIALYYEGAGRKELRVVSPERVNEIVRMSPPGNEWRQGYRITAALSHLLCDVPIPPDVAGARDSLTLKAVAVVIHRFLRIFPVIPSAS